MPCFCEGRFFALAVAPETLVGGPWIFIYAHNMCPWCLREAACWVYSGIEATAYN